jgi:hypothetical protein
MSKKGMLGAVTVHEARGVVADLLAKLGGRNGRVWLESLKDFLREDPGLAEEPKKEPKVEPKTSSIWKTITIGCMPKYELLAELEAKGYEVVDWARDMIFEKAFTPATESREVDLVVVMVRNLDFPEGAGTREIWSRAKELGLELCPAGVGPYLRLTCTDQPLHEHLYIAMEQIAASNGNQRVFAVTHECGRLALSAFDGLPLRAWRSRDQFVFVRPRKPADLTDK